MDDRPATSQEIKYDTIKLFFATILVVVFAILCAMGQIILMMHKNDGRSASIAQMSMAVGVFGVFFAFLQIVWAYTVTVSNDKLIRRSTRFIMCLGFLMVGMFVFYCASVYLEWETTDTSIVVAIFLILVMLTQIIFMLWFGRFMYRRKETTSKLENGREYLEEAQRLSTPLPSTRRASFMKNDSAASEFASPERIQQALKQKSDNDRLEQRQKRNAFYES